LPVDFGLTDPPVELKFNDQKITSVFGGKLPSQQTTRRESTEAGEITGLQQMDGNDVRKAAAADQSGTRGDAEANSNLDPNPDSKPITVGRVVTAIYFFGVAAFLMWQFGLYL